MNFPSRGEKKKDKKGALILPQTLYKYSSKLFSSGLQKFADVTAVITYGTPNPGLANCCQCTPLRVPGPAHCSLPLHKPCGAPSLLQPQQITYWKDNRCKN